MRPTSQLKPKHHDLRWMVQESKQNVTIMYMETTPTKPHQAHIHDKIYQSIMKIEHASLTIRLIRPSVP